MTATSDSLSQTQTRIAELEKLNQKLQHDLDLAQSELQHKSAILAQTNTELAEMQTQYKEVLQKLTEVSEHPPSKDLPSEQESLFRSQLREQSVCISTLQNRLWKAEHQTRLYRSQEYQTPIGRGLFGKSGEIEKENQKWREFGGKLCEILAVGKIETDGEEQRNAALAKVEGLREGAEAAGDYEKLREKYEKVCDCLAQIQGKLDAMTEGNERRREEESRQEEVGEREREGVPAEIGSLSRIARDLNDDYRRIRGRFDRNLSIEELADLNGSF
jgi:Asp-tRNA(Asn)/Glu-tRNA(Gln) amidotransferase C subunit